MHIAPRRWCQRPVWVALTSFFAVGVLLGGGDPAFSQDAPAWRRDLNAALALRMAFGSPPDAAAKQREEDRLLALYVALGAKYPRESAVQRAVGNFCGEIGRQELAIHYWQLATSLDPRDADSAASLGDAAAARGDMREARRQYQQAVAARPGEALFHFALANVLYLFRHDLADPPGLAGSEEVLVSSLEQFRLAAALAPLDARLAQAYAETFYILAQPPWSDALAAWQKVRSLNAKNPDFADGNLARVSLRLGQPDEADKYLAEIRDPRFDEMKAKLHAQAVSLRKAAAPNSP